MKFKVPTKMDNENRPCLIVFLLKSSTSMQLESSCEMLDAYRSKCFCFDRNLCVWGRVSKYAVPMNQRREL